MATLTNYIRLVDGTSGPLRAMARNAETATRAVGGVSPALRSIGDSAGSVDSATNVLNRFSSSARNALNIISGIGIGTMLGNMATQAVEKLSAMPSRLVGIAGQYAGIQARLKLLVGDQAKVAEMNDAIYQSALRSRGSFEQMADAVTKIGMTAKEAFPDSKQVVPFVEGIQKLFAIGGTGAQQQGDAMLQLTQALGSGKLQGDEFRSIAEAAPLIEQMVAKYMGVSQGALKELSSKGAITADILKNAILSNLDEINSQFATMPMTFDQQMQRLGTIAYKAFAPVFEVINKAMASPVFQSAMDKLAIGVNVLANVSLWALSILGELFDGVANNLKWLGDSVISASAGMSEVLLPILGAIASVWLALNAAQIANAAISGITAAAHFIAAGATALWTAATTFLSGATLSLGAVLSFVGSGPLAFFISLIAFIPLVIAAVIGAFLAWKVATNGLRATFVSAFETIGNVIDTVVVNATNAINKLIDVVNEAAKSINNAFGWAGANIQMTGHVSVADLGGNTHGARWRQWAADTYDNTAEWVANMFKPPEIKPIDMSSIGGGGSMPSADDLGKALKGNTGRTADNTGRMANSLDLLEEDIKDMRYATQEQINKYTNAKVTIEVGGINNTISSDTDVDGVMSKIVEALQEGMSNGAEAVLY